MEDKQTLEAFKTLLDKSIGLYTNGTLMQYGLDEEKSLDIVSNLTGISKEKLIEMKNNRYNSIKESMDQDLSSIGTLTN